MHIAIGIMSPYTSIFSNPRKIYRLCTYTHPGYNSSSGVTCSMSYPCNRRLSSTVLLPRKCPTKKRNKTAFLSFIALLLKQTWNDDDPRVWCDILNLEVDRKVYFNNIYDCMLTKNESDLIWKIRHGAIPTGRFLYGCKYSDSPNCNYCGELDDLTHIFVTCSRLSGLFQLTQSLIRKLTPTIDKIHVWWYIIDIPASAGLDVNVRRLCNWIFAQAKIAIVYSRFNKYKSSGTQCVVTLLKAKVISRVNVEYQFARFQNTVCNFVERWNTYNVLGNVENDNIVFNL